MRLSFLLFVFALAVAGLEFKPSPSLSPARQFQQYVAFWNKTYASEAEGKLREATFLKSAIKIAQLNSESERVGSSAKFGFTKFADWEAAEFKEKLLGLKLHRWSDPSHPVKILEKRAEKLQAPSGAIDWVAKGMTTAVKNQEQCGSCWAFSATETVESANLQAGRQVMNLSPQEIVDCDTADDGCNGGDPREAIGWVKQQGGQDTNQCYPYTAQTGSCQMSQCTPALTVRSVIPVAEDESAIYSQLQQMPLSICCDAEPWQYYTGGILDASQCGLSIDHAIQLTGYSPNQGGYWIVRNSWGADWGENGFIYLQYGQNTCGITSEVTGATA